SAALISEKGVLAAIAEERINRRKHCADFPILAIQEVLRIAGAKVTDLTDIAVARAPFANMQAKARFLLQYPESGMEMARRRFAVHQAVQGTPDRICTELGIPRDRLKAAFHQVEHHVAHAASAFFWSPFERATALTIDGAGDFATTLAALCEGNDIRVLRRSFWPHSLGVFYTALCQFIGFDRYGEEYKVMGLAAYGRDRFSSVMRDLVAYRHDAGLRLNLDYYEHHRTTTSFETIVEGEIVLPRLWGPKLERALGPARPRNSEIGEREQDIAASVQKRYEEVFLEMVSAVVRETGQRDIVMAGGCALNSVANGRMITEGYVDRAYFQSAASDDGTAIGAALYVLHTKHRAARNGPVTHSYWGTEWGDAQIEPAVRKNGRPFRKLERQDLLDVTTEALAKGKIVGWFQGREEWGPRALGNRSILCNPAVPDMKATLNARIKNREPFRPFAPIIREEDLPTVFEGTHPVPFMIIVYKVRPEWRPKLPAITHEDGTGRVQTINRDQNALSYDLITTFQQRTGVPVLLNTSFNENEPIVHTPEQAIDCFERTRMDALCIGSYWLEKSEG
ncbi:MAG TPA: carbamoyltransferase C-terminal domain-containing protein, partial [Candidatus Eisenbacteria bacterium]|nr:carbamoyltransferase C-terminal domain-containing protein [Candidatus Eisenbacteria bacterium]